MGGIGSGRRWHFSAKNTTADYRRLDIRRWAREGFLQPGERFGWQWTQDGETVASIRVAVEIDSLRLIYRTRSSGEDWQDMDYRVRLARTPCHFGGERVWFHCPARGCRQRVAILYGGNVFACRHCYQLAYPSQRDDALDRSLNKVEKLRTRLGWQGSAWDGQQGKPKGMHWRTYDRLVEAIERENHAAYGHILNRFGNDPSAVALAAEELVDRG